MTRYLALFPAISLLAACAQEQSYGPGRVIDPTEVPAQGAVAPNGDPAPVSRGTVVEGRLPDDDSPDIAATALMENLISDLGGIAGTVRLGERGYSVKYGGLRPGTYSFQFYDSAHCGVNGFDVEDYQTRDASAASPGSPIGEAITITVDPGGSGGFERIYEGGLSLERINDADGSVMFVSSSSLSGEPAGANVATSACALIDDDDGGLRPEDASGL